MSTECPVCRHASSEIKRQDYHERLDVDCYKCGRYSITRTALVYADSRIKQNSSEAASLSYTIRRLQERTERPMINSGNIEQLITLALPSPQEMIDNFILWLGKSLAPDIGRFVEVNQEVVASIVGAASGSGIAYAIKELDQAPHIRRSASGTIGLSLLGWQRYDELTRTKLDTRLAFMAMPFTDARLQQIFRDVWVPAVKETGFDLRKLDDKERAGLIDDRLRIEIRRSRFLIAELTGDNRGAYWEAGFAEGLGRPVIYTCEASHDPAAMIATHFDTNHHLTITWEADKLDDAAERLKGVIRETLPSEAIMGDGL